MRRLALPFSGRTGEAELEESDRRRYSVVVLALLSVAMLAALWLRIAGHNWDQDQHLNVDDYYVARTTARRINLPSETALTPRLSLAPGPRGLPALLDPATSPLNPRAGGEFFVYGTLPPYLVKAASASLSAVTNNLYFTGTDGVLQTGRVMAGVFDALTALLVFIVGLRLWGAWHGLLAATFYAFGALPIQMGHFYIVDTFMNTFMVTALLCSVLFGLNARPWLIPMAGLFAGLAMACKLSAAPIIVVPILAAFVFTRMGPAARTDWASTVALIGLALVGAGVGLFVGDPFAVLDAPTYLRVLGEQAAIHSGQMDEWWTRKYVGTWPLLHVLGQVVLIGIGPLVGVAGVAGALLVAARMWSRARRVELLLAAGAGAYLLSIAFAEVKWVRYQLPLAPYLALFAAVFLLWVLDRSSARPFAWSAAAVGLGVVVISAIFGGLAVSAIFRTEHTQIRASRWIYENAPPGSAIGIEKTAIFMPLALPGHPTPEEEYQIVTMDPMADLPSEEASATLHEQLSAVDYLILDTTQAARTVPRLPWRYPVQIRYYDLLFSEQLGFKTALVVTSYPRLFGLQIPDDGGWVDPSFMDSSHPPVWVFQKERTLTQLEWFLLFEEAVRQPSIASRQAP